VVGLSWFGGLVVPRVEHAIGGKGGNARGMPCCHTI